MRTRKNKRKREPQEPVKIIQQGEYAFIKVRKDACGFVVDNAMEYLIYKSPNYGNWVTDEELEDWGKLEKYLETHSSENDWNTGGVKLPTGKWNLIGKADKIEKGNWDEILASHEMKSETTLILRKATH